MDLSKLGGHAVDGFVAVVILIASIFVVLFLGGLTSAALEIRREKKAGLPVTRPGWEASAKRKARGWRGGVKASWDRVTKMGLKSCWCGCGPVAEFPAIDGQSSGSQWGCAAWEAGDPVAIDRHDRAGGYSRVDVA